LDEVGYVRFSQTGSELLFKVNARDLHPGVRSLHWVMRLGDLLGELFSVEPLLVERFQLTLEGNQVNCRIYFSSHKRFLRTSL